MIYENLIIEEFRNPETRQLLTTEYERVVKCDELATKMRVAGNDLFISKKHDVRLHESIWDSYLCSIALSTNRSETLATSYGNMSALMFHVRKYQACIDNIESALKMTKSIPLKIKLLTRKAKCLCALGMPEKDKVLKEAKSWLSKIDDKDKGKRDLIHLVDKAKIILSKNKVRVKKTASIEVNEDSINKNKTRKKKGKKGRKENSEFEHLKILKEKEKEDVFTSVAISYNYENNSQLIATRNITAGEIIFVTKPYIVVPHFLKSQNFCNNCLNTVWHAIPCENCACCMYCSEQCQIEAEKKYHDIECSVLQYLLLGDSWLDYYVQASVRAVIMGVRDFGSIANLMQQLKDVDNCTDKFKEFSDFQHDSFLSIFGFNNVYIDPGVLSDFTKVCCKTVICLIKFTSFFENHKQFDTIEDIIENKEIVFIASLLLRVAAIAFNNGIKVSEYGLYCTSNPYSSACNSQTPCCEKGYSLNTLCQFIPHSCNPNIKSLKIDGCKDLYYALQPIYEGEPLFECYQSTFFELELTYRANSIAQILNRNCYCKACEEGWDALLIEDGKMMDLEQLIEIVVESREHNNQKERFLKLLQKHGVDHQDIVDELSKIMDANYDYFGQPSVEVCATMYLIHYVFAEMYGMKFDMPYKCKT